jgi:hypothetical protein
MFNVCPGCGEYSDDKEIRGQTAICRACGYSHPFKRLPLFVITGASCTGKTTVGLHLPDRLQQECVCLESDILWRDEFNKPEDDYRDYRNLWLRMAKNISQSGRPVVLIGSSTPGQFEACSEARYFSRIHYLALVCQDQELERRLTSRPDWRKSGSPEVINSMLSFNRWFGDNAIRSNIQLLDTTKSAVDETIESVIHWIRDSISKVDG